jgi:hypothetical protein
MELKLNNIYLIKKGDIECYATFHSVLGRTYIFDNSGSGIVVYEDELEKCVSEI